MRHQLRVDEPGVGQLERRDAVSARVDRIGDDFNVVHFLFNSFAAQKPKLKLGQFAVLNLVAV